ncbi:MAG: helix-turn-helix domain-containing protein [Clostridia bacterium]|nr:helix-turn-helix domain-containing protein [Clostridia bacterium]
MKDNDKILQLSKNGFLKDNENIHIHMSNEYPSYAGVLHSCNFMKINYIISGKARFEFGNQVYEAQKGDLVMVNKDIAYKFTEIEDTDETLLFYELIFNDGILRREPLPSYPYRLLEGSFAFYSLRDKESHPFIFFNFSKTSHSMYGEFFNKMYMEYRRAKSGYNDVMMAYLTLIIINAVRLNETLGNSDEKIYRKQAVEFVQNYINRCFCDNNISVRGLADLVYLNTDYLGRIFKKDTGKTINEAIQEKRIENVCRLLATTDRSINEIANESGFTDMHFFYKVFKNRMGVLPSEYRESTKH